MPKKNILDIDAINSLPKKRGRKPKGGKIITEMISTNDSTIEIPNIIMHLNCNTIDMTEIFDSKMKYSPELSIIENYDTAKDHIFSNNYTFIDCNPGNPGNPGNIMNSMKINSSKEDDEMIDTKGKSGACISSIEKKIDVLTHNLHDNAIDKQSACFWCSYNFTNEPFFIPKSINTACKSAKMNNQESESESNNANAGKMSVYGCFCTPQCAVAYLMNENIDTTSKYERYYLLNYVYDKSGETVIKPAPNPYYTLERFYGNLTIEEYRKMITQENLVMIDNKPLSRVFPELFEDNTDYVNSGSLNNKYKIKPYQSSTTANSKSMF